MIPCNCDVGMCTHQSNCRKHSPHVTTFAPDGFRRQQQEQAMARDNEPQRSKADRIERLRKRLDAVTAYGPAAQLRDVIKGLLDLLADEL